MKKESFADEYQSFLLRCHRVEKGAEGSQTAVWRFTLLDISAEPQEHTFSSIVDLNSFLIAKLNRKDASE